MPSAQIILLATACVLSSGICGAETLLGSLNNGHKHSIITPHFLSTQTVATDAAKEAIGVGCLSKEQRIALSSSITRIKDVLSNSTRSLRNATSADPTDPLSMASAELESVSSAITEELSPLLEDPCPTCTAVTNGVHDILHSHGFHTAPGGQMASIIAHIDSAWQQVPALRDALEAVAVAVSATQALCPDAFASEPSVTPALSELQLGGICDSVHGLQCYGDDLQDIGAVSSHEQCCQACQNLPGCAAWTWNWQYGQHCYLKSACNDKRTGSDAYHSGVAPAPTPPPSPTPPTPPSPSPPSPGKSTSFFVIGDWGYNAGCHGNVKSGGQRAIARSMQAEFQRRGGNVPIVINVGDSFYASGVNSVNDGRWNSVWAGVYNLPGTTWYSTYGNHDLGSQDPCGKSDRGPCIQVEKHNARMNGMTWYMPDLNYVVDSPVPGVGIISVDTNVAWRGEICKYIGGDCYGVLQRRYDAGKRLLDETIQKAVDGNFPKNILVFSHYPTDYCGGSLPASFCDSLKRSGENGIKIHYFAGHRHAVDDTSVAAYKVGSAKSWLVGGGGGWGCDGSPNQYENQGFLVGDIDASGVVTNLKPVFTPRNQVC